MLICGIKWTSLIDYPGKIAAVVYTNSCNFRCPFCHNHQLALGRENRIIAQEQLIKMLASRRGFIDGIVITGGEPTVHHDLGEFILEIKKIELLVKLDTNGSNPEMLEKLLIAKRVDFVAMDIKTSWRKYRTAAGVDIDTSRLSRSIDMIKQSGIDFEFRTTCVPSLVDESDIGEISQIVGKKGRYTLQQFQPHDTLDLEYSKIEPYPRETLVHFGEIASPNVGTCRIIGV